MGATAWHDVWPPIMVSAGQSATGPLRLSVLESPELPEVVLSVNERCIYAQSQAVQDQSGKTNRIGPVSVAFREVPRFRKPRNA